MSFSINKVYLVGNLARDPEIKQTPSGTSVCNFSLATNHSIKKGDEWKDIPTFHRVVVFGKLADLVAKNYAKGDKLVIEGRIDNRSYENKAGEKKYISEVIADTVIGLAKTKTFTKKEEEPADPNPEELPGVDTTPDVSDDIPF